MRGYQNPSLHSGNVTDQRGIAPRVTLGRPPTLTEKSLKTIAKIFAVASAALISLHNITIFPMEFPFS